MLCPNWGFRSDPVLVPSPSRSDTNMACVILTNSSLVCLGRPGLGVLAADNWRDVKTYGKWRVPGGVGIQGEDPMLWQDKRGVLHAVTHGGGWGQPFVRDVIAPRCVHALTAHNVPRSLACVAFCVARGELGWDTTH